MPAQSSSYLIFLVADQLGIANITLSLGNSVLQGSVVGMVDLIAREAVMKERERRRYGERGDKGKRSQRHL